MAALVGQPLHLAIYVGLIVFFTFFYTAVVFNPQETAENLRKYGGFILGYRPGQKTAEYIDYVLTRITVVGAIYLSAVCVLPEFLISYAAVPFYFGGTSLLIVVSVTMDTVAQVQSHLLAHQYEGLIKKAKLRGATGAAMNLILWVRRVQAKAHRRQPSPLHVGWSSYRRETCCGLRSVGHGLASKSSRSWARGAGSDELVAGSSTSASHSRTARMALFSTASADASASGSLDDLLEKRNKQLDLVIELKVDDAP